VASGEWISIRLIKPLQGFDIGGSCTQGGSFLATLGYKISAPLGRDNRRGYDFRGRATVSLRWLSRRLAMSHYIDPDGLRRYRQAKAKLLLSDVCFSVFEHLFRHGVAKDLSPRRQPSAHDFQRPSCVAAKERNHLWPRFLPLLPELLKLGIDETGLTNTYDIDFHWNSNLSGNELKKEFPRLLNEQLGLELVPTHMPIEMLLVEKAK
jgi:hypothetical protein